MTNVIRLLVAALAALPLFADPRINPPTIQQTSPLAVTRGLTTTVEVRGINLVGAAQVVFDNPAVSGRVVSVNDLGTFEGRFIGSNGTVSSLDRGDPAPLNQVRIEVEAAADAEVGLTRFRLVTANGATLPQSLAVEPYFGVRPEIEPNDHPAQALRGELYVFPPTIVSGRIDRSGDVDYLPFEASAGDELVFRITGPELGSKIRWRLALMDTGGVTLASKAVFEDRGEAALAFRAPADGRYLLAVSDIEAGGGKDHFYRVKIGQYPYLTGAWPLGVGRGETREVSLRGYNLGDQRNRTVEGRSSYLSTARLDLRPEFDAGRAHNSLMLAVGEYSEAFEQDAETSLEAASEIEVGSTVNGRISGFAQRDRLESDEDYFRFQATRGENYVIEVEAGRLGSPLDSVVEILTPDGAPVSRATVRAEFATRTVLSDRDSAKTGLRLEDLTHFQVGDYVLVGNEILRVRELPRGPDSDYSFHALGGRRTGYFDTTPEAQAIDTPVYKVTIHPPQTAFPPNGLPVRQLYYRNDDGGSGFAKDSRLSFTPSAGGEYLIRLRDLRGLQGEDFAYRLNLRHARPDFRLSLGSTLANVPRGGAAAIAVNAQRLDGYRGPVRLEARNLPPGLTASAATIAAGENTAVIVISAATDAQLARAVPLEIVGSARIDSETIVHTASADDDLRLIAVADPGDVLVEIESDEVELEAGGEVQIAVRVERRNGFSGRVPISVLNLPYGVKVIDIGLNGVLVTPEQTRRVFTVAALPGVAPAERSITVTARVETRSPLRLDYAAQPIKLRIVPGKATQASPSRTRSTGAR